MSESPAGIKEHIARLQANMDIEGRVLSPNRRVAYATSIAQRKYLASHTDVLEGAQLIQQALKWPPEYAWVAYKGDPNVSDKTWMVALATYELLALVSPYDRLSLPQEQRIFTFAQNISRLADGLERNTGEFDDLKDVLFARMANAIVVLSKTRTGEQRRKVLDKLQQTSRSLQEMPLSKKHIEEQEHEKARLGQLVDTFNKAQWYERAVQEGEAAQLVDTLFRFHQGAPI